MYPCAEILPATDWRYSKLCGFHRLNESTHAGPNRWSTNTWRRTESQHIKENLLVPWREMFRNALNHAKKFWVYFFFIVHFIVFETIKIGLMSRLKPFLIVVFFRISENRDVFLTYFLRHNKDKQFGFQATFQFSRHVKSSLFLTCCNNDT